jgi:hypothetical protein
MEKYVNEKNPFEEFVKEHYVSGEPTEDPADEAANNFLLNQSLKEQEEETELQAYLDRLKAEREKRENELLCPLDD